MNVRSTRLPDGRYFLFYDFLEPDWTSVTGSNPSIEDSPRIGLDHSSELRWNPVLAEWVVTAVHRQDRTFLPSVAKCPFCLRTEEGGEIPGDYDVAVLANRFPSLQPNPGTPSIEESALYPVRPSQGVCEVVLYSADHQRTLAQLPVEQIYKLVLVWTSRYSQLSRLEFVKYVFIFENKGESIGVTLHHPHGQIYAYPFCPPRISTELMQSKLHQDKTGSCLFCDILQHEIQDGRRIVFVNQSFVVFVPFYARWPYEVHITSRRHIQSIAELDSSEQRHLAAALKALLEAYDRLFGISFPYMMVMHQKPTDRESYDYYHFHIEFYPPMRSAEKLKYLAGSETGAGMFINDSLPESKAAELRAQVRPVVWPSVWEN
jgi:UDPglucose--hexose-1-phosphate uridylyltransferase